MEKLYIGIIVVAVMSLVTFTMYAIDKRRAIKGKWRVPEATLLILSLLLGGVGGYVAMFLTHHKTRKWYFHLVNILGIALSVVTLMMLGGVFNI